MRLRRIDILWIGTRTRLLELEQAFHILQDRLRRETYELQTSSKPFSPPLPSPDVVLFHTNCKPVSVIHTSFFRTPVTTSMANHMGKRSGRDLAPWGDRHHYKPKKLKMSSPEVSWQLLAGHDWPKWNWNEASPDRRFGGPSRQFHNITSSQAKEERSFSACPSLGLTWLTYRRASISRSRFPAVYPKGTSGEGHLQWLTQADG